jgi:hypothetical protein
MFTRNLIITVYGKIHTRHLWPKSSIKMDHILGREGLLEMDHPFLAP